LDLETDVAARELGIADNRSGEIGLAWDVEALNSLAEDGVQMQQFFRDAEWAKLREQPNAAEGEPIPEMALQPFEEYNYLMIVCKNSQDWQGLCDKLSIRREAVTLGETRKVGLGRVLDGSKLLAALCKSSSQAANGSRRSRPTPSDSSQTPPSVSEPAKPERIAG